MRKILLGFAATAAVAVPLVLGAELASGAEGGVPYAPTVVRISSVDESAFQSAWSPDGSQIAFVKSNDATGQNDLYVANPDGSGATRLLRGAEYPAWSPDGLTLAVTRYGSTSGSLEIWTMGADGSNPTQVTHGGAPGRQYREPSWSPDGSQIAFGYIPADGSADVSEIGVMDADGTNPHPITSFPGDDYAMSPAWSPTGDQIGFSFVHYANDVDAWDFYLVTPDGSDVTPVTAGRTWFDVTWSPTGAEIAFTNSVPGAPDPIQIAAADGTGATTVTPEGFDADQVTWSPNGVDLAMNGKRLPDEVLTGIYVLRLDRTPPDEVPPTVDLRSPVDGAAYPHGSSVVADYSCTDVDGVGVSTCEGTVADGEPVDTSTIGLHEFTVTAVDNAGNTSEVTHTYTVAHARPDGRIRLGRGVVVGNNAYSTSGINQTRTGSAARGQNVTYFVSVQNDAPFAERLRLQGQASTANFSVRYQSPANINITSQVTAGTFRTPILSPLDSYQVKVVVTVLNSAPRNSSTARTLTAVSTTHPTIKDTVKFVTSRS